MVAEGAEGETEPCTISEMLQRVHENRGDKHHFDLAHIKTGHGLGTRKKWIKKHCKSFQWFLDHVSSGEGDR